MRFSLRSALLALTLLFLTACSDTHKPEMAINEFYDELSLGRYSQAIVLFDLGELPEAFHEKGLLYETMTAIFEELARNIRAKGGIEQIDFSSVEFNEAKDEAVVRYTLQLKDGSSTPDTLYLTKDETHFWRLTL